MQYPAHNINNQTCEIRAQQDHKTRGTQTIENHPEGIQTIIRHMMIKRIGLKECCL